MRKINATIQMDVPQPKQIRDYFLKKGWKNECEFGSFTRFTKKDEAYLAMLDETHPDYDRNCEFLIKDIGDIEHRASGDILKEILDVNCPCCGYPSYCGHSICQGKPDTPKMTKEEFLKMPIFLHEPGV